MSLVPHNVTLSASVAHPVYLRDIVDFAGKPIQLTPGVAVELLDYAPEEVLAKSFHLKHLRDSGLLTVNSSVELSAASSQEALETWVQSGDMIIQFFSVNGPSSDNTYSGPHAGTLVNVGVTNGVGVLDPFNNTATIELAITGGTAASPKINGVVGPVLLTVSHGMASATISASGAGSVLLGLQNGNTSLDHSDTATVNLS